MRIAKLYPVCFAVPIVSAKQLQKDKDASDSKYPGYVRLGVWLAGLGGIILTLGSMSEKEVQVREGGRLKQIPNMVMPSMVMLHYMRWRNVGVGVPM